jgi:hypothetical protein
MSLIAQPKSWVVAPPIFTGQASANHGFTGTSGFIHSWDKSIGGGQLLTRVMVGEGRPPTTYYTASGKIVGDRPSEAMTQE